MEFSSLYFVEILIIEFDYTKSKLTSGCSRRLNLERIRLVDFERLSIYWILFIAENRGMHYSFSNILHLKFIINNA